jgi:hypothetical protein
VACASVLKVTGVQQHSWIYGLEFKIAAKDRRFCWIDLRPRGKARRF